MRIQLLGTGAADGIPNPFCECGTCVAALQAGEVRGQTAALVDEVLLIDCGPEIPRAASRHGASLSRVRHFLLTHSHPDHAGPMATLFRSWARTTEPLDLVGPSLALDVFRDWVGPNDPVTFRPVEAGDVLSLGGYEVRVLAASHGDSMTGPGVLYDVTGPDGGRLLYATDTGPLAVDTLKALQGRRFGVVLLEESFGSITDHGTDHLDLSTFPEAILALRNVAAITDDTDVVAVHLGHHNPPTPELNATLTHWGARVVPDGTVLGDRCAHRTLVLGGARSGKSVYAERLVTHQRTVRYVATGGTREGDAEWAERVVLHQKRRPEHWTTSETTDLVSEVQSNQPGDCLLIDCLSLWLAAVLDATGTWTAADATARQTAETAVDQQIEALVAALNCAAGTVVAVSNEVGSGVVPGTASGRLYRDALGRLNALVAQAATSVVLVVAGQPLVLKHDRMEHQR